MLRIDFYPDKVYKEAQSLEEKREIKAEVKKFNSLNKPIPNDLLYPRETSIYLYVRLKSKTIKLKIGEKILPKYWNFDTQEAKRAFTGSPELNFRLNTIKSEILKKYRLLLIDNNNVSWNQIEEMVKGVINSNGPILETNDERGFYQIYDEFVEVRKVECSLSTIKKFKTLAVHLKGFEETKRYKISFETITPTFYDRFKSYMILNLKHTNNTIGKYFAALKTFMNWSNERGYHSSLNFQKFKVCNEPGDIIYLTHDELMSILNCDLTNHPVLNKVRDVFCFGCFTGQRYSDIAKLKREDIRGGVWFLKTKKTRDSLEIPLNDFAIEILNKYKDFSSPLPIIANQKMNYYLKDLGKLLDINDITTKTRYSGKEVVEEIKPKYEFISTHTARRTFVTLSLEKGMRPETVMSITGHKDYKTMQRYLKITSKVKVVEMNSVWRKNL
jgi:integrase